MRKRQRPTPEVLALFREGKISAEDVFWIGRMPPESQLAAAIRCGRPNPTFNIQEQAKSSVTHGTPSIQERR